MKALIYSRVDECGNELRIYKERSAPEVLDIRLYINAEGKERKLGLVNKKTATLLIVRQRNRHLHAKSNSYGFNYVLLNEAQTFDTVIIRDEIAAYKVPRHVLLQKGVFLFFKQQGFERQIFVTLATLENYCTREILF